MSNEQWLLGLRASDLDRLEWLLREITDEPMSKALWKRTLRLIDQTHANN